jgi:hypothetical protein
MPLHLRHAAIGGVEHIPQRKSYLPNRATRHVFLLFGILSNQPSAHHSQPRLSKLLCDWKISSNYTIDHIVALNLNSNALRAHCGGWYRNFGWSEFQTLKTLASTVPLHSSSSLCTVLDGRIPPSHLTTRHLHASWISSSSFNCPLAMST